MDEKTEVIDNEQPTKSAGRSRKKTILVVLLVLILVGAAAGAAYWWRDMSAKDKEKQQVSDLSSMQQKNTKLEKELADEKAKSAGSTSDKVACTSKSPSAAAIGNIEASITSGNTAALEGYMASSVNVIIAASEGFGAKTPAQAVSSISNFITSDPSSWDYDFGLSASLVGSYGKGFFGQYFPDNAVAAKASNQKVISFSFDCNGKISTVFLAANASLL